MKNNAPDSKLAEKAILVIGNDTNLIKSLINDLAQKGADIVLICWQMQLESLIKIKESIQATGSRFLLIEQAKAKTFSSQELLDAITAELGHQLDAIIDMTGVNQNLLKKHDTTTPWLQKPNWPLTNALALAVA